MRYQDLRQKLGDFVVFSLVDIRKIEPKFLRRRLNEWQDKGYIKKLRRGFYAFSDLALNEETLFLIANRLYLPSYVSFETALSYYGLIPEGVYSVTSAATKKTANFKSPVANFMYHRIKPRLYFGYRLEKKQGQGYKIAEMEKAVLDYLYLHPEIVREADFHEWRFDGKEFLAKADLAKMRRYAAEFGNRQIPKRLEKLLKLMKTE
jgi:predicted transcriptional regulator of viral defense system